VDNAAGISDISCPVGFGSEKWIMQSQLRRTLCLRMCGKKGCLSRGRRVAGGELRHLAGSPGGGGDIRVLSYSN
jgi:hypothetical protein